MVTLISNATTILRVLGYGAWATAKWVAIAVAFAIPLWVPMLASFLIFGVGGIRWAAIAVLSIAFVGVAGILAGSNWDRSGHWESWKWDSDEVR